MADAARCRREFGKRHLQVEGLAVGARKLGIGGQGNPARPRQRCRQSGVVCAGARFGEQHVVTNSSHLGLGQAVDDVRMDLPRPRPSTDRSEALLVNLCDQDARIARSLVPGQLLIEQPVAKLLSARSERNADCRRGRQDENDKPLKGKAQAGQVFAISRR